MPDISFKQIQEAVNFIQNKINLSPKVGLVLGTGLSGLSTAIQNPMAISYEEIPNFPVSTVQSHLGKLIFGEINGVKIVAMAGRFHYYEGYTMKEVTFPIKVLKLLGIQQLIISNASGGVNPKFSTGEVVLIKDHINLQPENPLRGKNIDALGSRFPDMVDPYDKLLRSKMLQTAKKLNIILKEAVYVGVQGPNLETKAEFRYFKIIGGDIVGMSTVPEVIVANHMKLPVVALSIVTNEGWSEHRKEANVEEIIEIAQKSSSVVEKLVTHYLQSAFN